MNEHEAVARLKKGDIEGLKVLVQRYQLQAVRAAYFIIQDKMLAEEVVQEAFLRVYERIKQFDINRPFPPWFFRIVTNMALKTAQKEKRSISLETPISSPETTLLELMPDELPEPEDVVAMQQLQEEVWQVLEQLTPKQRSVVVMRYYLDMGVAEMSNKMEIAAGTVKWHLYAARKRLRTLLTANRIGKPDARK